MSDNLPDMRLDTAALVREETFTDGRAGSIRRLTPVLATGEVDPARAVEYTGHTQVMTEAGPLPINFALDADTLEEAVNGFAEQAKQALQEMIRRIEEMRRESASSIVTPGQPGFGGGMGGMGGPGGMGGAGGPGGGIQLR